ncbi:hypothetical protein PV726_49470 [Streptomyces europaeiscabiei]|uniref:hypothetical protein n=1 Tax=Streptomyces europaeiscabiei TaxID=146819 RepID=UPI0029ADB6BD|nr:hypothetical protein [Streptomyces europaeiscabiei]MDX3698036.1 hypothetical protein [Streptomyces europaeiscabiei]
MSEKSEVRGTLKKVREETVEIYELVLDLDDASREKLRADPHGVIQRFLESQGQTVNRLTTDPQVSDEVLRDSTWRSGWHHMPSGPEKSRWDQIFL